MNLEDIKNKPYYTLMNDLYDALDNYADNCINMDPLNSHNPSPNNVITCLNALINENIDDSLFNTKLIQLLCEKIIKNSKYIRGIDSAKIFKAIDFSKIGQNNILYLANYIINVTRENISPYALNPIFEMIKEYLPSDIVLAYKKEYDYGISEEGEKAYQNKFINSHQSSNNSENTYDLFWSFGALICMIIGIVVLLKCFGDISLGMRFLFFILGIGFAVLGVFLYSKISQKTIDMTNSLSSNNLRSSQSPNIPKCPTCGSTNVEKISTAKKAFGFAMVGLFSSNLGKTMHCRNCGYKW